MPIKEVLQLAPGIGIKHDTGNPPLSRPFYIGRERDIFGHDYLWPDGYWRTHCGGAWYKTIEEAKSAFQKYLDSRKHLRKPLTTIARDFCRQFGDYRDGLQYLDADINDASVLYEKIINKEILRLGRDRYSEILEFFTGKQWNDLILFSEEYVGKNLFHRYAGLTF